MYTVCTLILSEVGKLTIEHLRPKHKPSTRHVGNIVNIKKKCSIERLYFLFWTAGNVEVQAVMFFYIEIVEGKTHFLVHNF